jgi:hypothetical protein
VKRGYLGVVVFDLDSTLAWTHHRWPLNPANNPDSSWDAYSAACRDDKPLDTITLTMLLWPHYEVHIVSGRQDSAREQTVTWLARHNVFYDELVLRKDGDHRPNAAYKVAYVKDLARAGRVTELVVEDWPETAQAVREETGIPVMVINPCYPPGAQQSPPVLDAVTASEGGAL